MVNTERNRQEMKENGTAFGFGVNTTEEQFRIQGGVKILPLVGLSGGVTFHADRLVSAWRLMPSQTNYQLGLDFFLRPPSLGKVGLDNLW